METSLHRQLKETYAGSDAQQEVRLGSYIIDAIQDNQLIEIQHGSLAAIRDKIATLLKQHRVLVVKPIVRRKRIVRQDEKDGQVLGKRLSPKRGQLLDVFHELVYFTRVFPHRKLTLEVPLVDIEEWRYPGHGRRRRWRRNDHIVQDQKLTEIHETHRFETGRDLIDLLPFDLPTRFHTGDLAERLELPRWFAQRIAYCLRKMEIVKEVGKRGNARLYQLPRRRRRAA